MLFDLLMFSRIFSCLFLHFTIKSNPKKKKKKKKFFWPKRKKREKTSTITYAKFSNNFLARELNKNT
jgi:hypothetical protein